MKARILAVLLAMLAVSAQVMAEGGVLLGVQVKDTQAPMALPTAEAMQGQTPAPVGEADALMAEITAEEIEASGLGGRILMRGMEGEDVKLLQRRLYQLGYYLGEVDGVFGLGTRTAVYGFQRAHKLEKIDGKIGP